MYKYVMFDDGMADQFIIFPKNMIHILIAEGITSRVEYRHWKLVSAGFVTIGKEGFITYGGSETLNIQSRPEDGQIITNHPWEFGIR